MTSSGLTSRPPVVTKVCFIDSSALGFLSRVRLFVTGQSFFEMSRWSRYLFLAVTDVCQWRRWWSRLLCLPVALLEQRREFMFSQREPDRPRVLISATFLRVAHPSE